MCISTPKREKVLICLSFKARKTQSVPRTAQSVYLAAIRQTIRKTPIIAREPRATQLRPVPLQQLARPLLQPVQSASPLKSHPNSRSAPGIVWMVQQTWNKKPHCSAACRISIVLAPFQSLSKSQTINPICLKRSMVSITSADGQSTGTIHTCFKDLQHVRKSFIFRFSTRGVYISFPRTLRPFYTDL